MNHINFRFIFFRKRTGSEITKNSFQIEIEKYLELVLPLIRGPDRVYIDTVIVSGLCPVKWAQ